MKRRVWFVSLTIVLALVLVCGFFFSSEFPGPSREVIIRRREYALKSDLLVMREAIQKYTMDKGQAPQSLQDLVSANYFREIPTDPFTQRKDWVPSFSDSVSSPDQKARGIADVHSASGRVGTNGVAYNLW